MRQHAPDRKLITRLAPAERAEDRAQQQEQEGDGIHLEGKIPPRMDKLNAKAEETTVNGHTNSTMCSNTSIVCILFLIWCPTIPANIIRTSVFNVPKFGVKSTAIITFSFVILLSEFVCQRNVLYCDLSNIFHCRN